jgi:hypothetical protein
LLTHLAITKRKSFEFDDAVMVKQSMDSDLAEEEIIPVGIPNVSNRNVFTGPPVTIVLDFPCGRRL